MYKGMYKGCHAMKRHALSTRVFFTEPSQRQLRVGEEIRHILAQIFLRGRVHEEILLRNSISVTEVRMSTDLKQARVFVMSLGGKELQDIVIALNTLAPIIRMEMAKQLTTKFIPRLLFKPDLRYERAERIDILLRSPHVERDLAAPTRNLAAPATDGERDDQ
jgi:ribosome-binding factor A